ncbi:MAG: RsmE family RNA methyltransferase [Candidatus Neomarinimicrobiota bacterium]|jgi:16S rRNA (uracil1498-N3)-methyltransferase|nr:RsmE family RNA methyltransferase [Candidatus Neomarinimicrobiota bacterium]MDD3965917.1 RsmE family RNA methyltransferase [Candidatus Neomarinimicrobiota bacterium]MDX9780102.1 RsmE family RNA methyltransferase [bacterium]
MANEQFFFSREIAADTLLLRGDEHIHLSRVLRKKPGEHIHVSDGEGRLVEAQILSIEKDTSRAKILRDFPARGEAQNRVALAVGIIKPAHWEILLEKSAELGVYEIFPLITRYTVKADYRRERSEKILLSAVKQCGRSRIPRLHPPAEFTEFIKQPHYPKIYICDDQDTYPRLRVPQTSEDALIFVGPEGGFHPDEVRLAIAAGANPVLLANRRLRSETACLLALSYLVV